MTLVYKTQAWLRMREQILVRDLWTCQVSGVLLSPGRKSPASAVVDHIIPALMRPDLELDPRNLWAVSKHIHDGALASIEAKHRDGRKIAEAKLSYKVVGLDGYPASPKRHEQIGLGLIG